MTIFVLKNKYKWQDKATVDNNVTITPILSGLSNTEVLEDRSKAIDATTIDPDNTPE
jgi:hypothetical protein